MAEGELEGLESDRAAEQLMPEADADHRLLADHPANALDDVVERAGVAGTIRQKDQVGISGEHLLRRAVAGQRDPATALPELTDDGVLDPSVEPDHMGAVPGDLDRLRRRHLASEVGTLHRGLGGDPLARLGLRGLGREDPRAHRAAVANVADEGAGIDPGDRRHPAVAQPVEPTALRRRDVLAVLPLA